MYKEVRLRTGEIVRIGLPDGRTVELHYLPPPKNTFARIGVQAPADVIVDRQEVHDHKQRQTQPPQ